MKQINKKNRINAVITRDPGFVKYLPYLKSNFNTKVFYETHNYFLDRVTSGVSKTQQRSWKKYNKIESKFISKLDGLICLLSPQEKLYKSKFPFQNVITANPGLLRIEEFDAKERIAKRIGYVGDLSSRRDIDTLFDSINFLRDKNTELLLIGGKPNELDRIHKMIEERDLNGRIIVTGWIDYKKMKNLIRTISVGVIPMKDTFYNRYLTAPMKVFDYMSYCIPTIAADLESSREFVEEGVNGLYYEPGNARDLALKIEYILEEPNILREFKIKTKQKAANMLWDARAERLENIISESF